MNMKICLSRWCFMASDGAVCLDKIHFSEEESGFVWTKFITFIKVCEFLLQPLLLISIGRAER